MPGWRDLAVESARAMVQLRDYPRSCVSRAYYAVYAACVGWLERQGLEPDALTVSGQPWFSHLRLVAQLEVALRSASDFGERLLDEAQADRLYDSVERLRKARTEADYDPEANVTYETASDAIRDASYVVRLLAEDEEYDG